MGLLEPAALGLLALIPVLALAYLVRERPQRFTVSSVMAFRALGGARGERPWGRPRFAWTFWVEALILALAALAIAGPFMIRERQPLVLVLDNSAMMQARMPSGQMRFDAARERLVQMLEGEAGQGEITIYLTAPQPHQFGAVLETVADARSALGHAEVTDAPDEVGALQRAVSELASGHRFSQVILAGAHPVSAEGLPRLRTITVGAPIPNYAIGSFILRRESFGSATLQARLTLANLSPLQQQLTVSVSGDGKPIARAGAQLQPREVSTIEFPSLPSAQIFSATLEPADAFPLDNTAWATAEAVGSISVLFVTPTPADAAGLASLYGVKLKTVAPENYSPADAARADLVIFEYAAPKELPPADALLVMPPAGEPVFGFTTAPATRIQIADWETPNPLTDGVNFRLFDLRAGELFGLHPWMEPVVDGDGGGLVLSGLREGHRFVATGFNPFPYLGKKNLPMSVLTLNLLSYLAGLGSDSAGYRTGEPWLVPAGVDKVVLPAGTKIAVRPATLFRNDLAQGVYELLGPGAERTLRATNLFNLAESDLENPLALKLEPTWSGAAPANVFTQNTPLTRYVIELLLALAALEAVLAYRRRRRAGLAVPA